MGSVSSNPGAGGGVQINLEKCLTFGPKERIIYTYYKNGGPKYGRQKRRNSKTSERQQDD